MKILKELRTRNGLTLRQVEEATGISNAYLSQLENGKNKKPSAQVLYSLSKLYNASIESLLISSGFIKEKNISPVKQSLENRFNDLEKRVSVLESEGAVYRRC